MNQLNSSQRLAGSYTCELTNAFHQMLKWSWQWKRTAINTSAFCQRFPSVTFKTSASWGEELAASELSKWMKQQLKIIWQQGDSIKLRLLKLLLQPNFCLLHVHASFLPWHQINGHCSNTRWNYNCVCVAQTNEPLHRHILINSYAQFGRYRKFMFNLRTFHNKIISFLCRANAQKYFGILDINNRMSLCGTIDQSSIVVLSRSNLQVVKASLQ
jgi:hypothetical protein